MTDHTDELIELWESCRSENDSIRKRLRAFASALRQQERDACARIAKLHISSALRIDNSDGLDNAGDIGECYANSTAEDIETAILAREKK